MMPTPSGVTTVPPLMIKSSMIASKIDKFDEPTQRTSLGALLAASIIARIP